MAADLFGWPVAVKTREQGDFTRKHILLLSLEYLKGLLCGCRLALQPAAVGDLGGGLPVQLRGDTATPLWHLDGRPGLRAVPGLRGEHLKRGPQYRELRCVEKLRDQRVSAASA